MRSFLRWLGFSVGQSDSPVVASDASTINKLSPNLRRGLNDPDLIAEHNGVLRLKVQVVPDDVDSNDPLGAIAAMLHSTLRGKIVDIADKLLELGGNLELWTPATNTLLIELPHTGVYELAKMPQVVSIELTDSPIFKLTTRLRQRLEEIDNALISVPIEVVVEFAPPVEDLATELIGKSRDEMIAAMQREFAAASVPVVDRLNELGGHVLAQVGLNRTLVVVLPYDRLLDLAKMSQIAVIDLPSSLQQEV